MYPVYHIEQFSDIFSVYLVSKLETHLSHSFFCVIFCYKHEHWYPWGISTCSINKPPINHQWPNKTLILTDLIHWQLILHWLIGFYLFWHIYYAHCELNATLGINLIVMEQILFVIDWSHFCTEYRKNFVLEIWQHSASILARFCLNFHHALNALSFLIVFTL